MESRRPAWTTKDPVSKKPGEGKQKPMGLQSFLVLADKNKVFPSPLFFWGGGESQTQTDPEFSHPASVFWVLQFKAYIIRYTLTSIFLFLIFWGKLSNLSCPGTHYVILFHPPRATTLKYKPNHKEFFKLQG